MKTRLTKQHFETIAAELRTITDEKVRTEKMNRAIEGFMKTNPMFDVGRFRLACTPGKKAVRTTPKTVEQSGVPGVSFMHHIQVDTSEWFEPLTQYEELHAVEFDGVRYIMEECREANRYPKGHVWAGQVCSQYIDIRHVFDCFVGRKPVYNCGKTGQGWQGYTLMDFLSDFLFNVEHVEHIEACMAYNVDMIFTVEPEKITAFERDLKKIYDVIMACKFEFEKDQPKE
jgi:hypothetical protein